MTLDGILYADLKLFTCSTTNDHPFVQVLHALRTSKTLGWFLNGTTQSTRCIYIPGVGLGFVKNTANLETGTKTVYDIQQYFTATDLQRET